MATYDLFPSLTNLTETAEVVSSSIVLNLSVQRSARKELELHINMFAAMIAATKATSYIDREIIIIL